MTLGESLLPLGGVFGPDPFGPRKIFLNPNSAKYHILEKGTPELVRRGSATANEIEKIVGPWVSQVLPTRLYPSVFHSCYRFTEIMKGCNTAKPLWNSLKAELMVATSLVPLCRSELRQEWFWGAYSTDASKRGGAAIRTTAAPTAVRMEARWAKGRGWFAPALPRSDLETVELEIVLDLAEGAETASSTSQDRESSEVGGDRKICVLNTHVFSRAGTSAGAPSAAPGRPLVPGPAARASSGANAGSSSGMQDSPLFGFCTDNLTSPASGWKPGKPLGNLDLSSAEVVRRRRYPGLLVVGTVPSLSHELGRKLDCGAEFWPHHRCHPLDLNSIEVQQDLLRRVAMGIFGGLFIRLPRGIFWPTVFHNYDHVRALSSTCVS